MSGMDSGAERVGDYGTPEQEIPPTGYGPGVDWESCMTMNNHWGFNKHDQNWKSSATLIRNLIDCASKGGNYLLNVGPTAQGTFPEPSIERLAEIGKWMKVNGEAIYDTQASPFKRLSFGRCTTKVSGKTTTLYLHVFDWPADGQLVIPGLKNNVRKAYLLADRKHRPLKAALHEDSVVLTLPSTAPDAAASVIVLKIREPLKVEAPGLAQKPDGTIVLPAIDALTHGDTVRYESGKDRDNLGFWTNPSDWVEWSFQVKRPGKFRVSADIATLGASSFVVSCQGQELSGTVSSTGDYGTFKPIELGTVEVSSGKVSLAVRPVNGHWEPVNLRSIKLVPVDPL
jgi:alpha-L-fucosidase